MGSIWTDFKPQIENLDKEKFTIVAWDPPGYGKSRAPDRTFPLNYFRRDANWAHSLMKILIAAEYPASVRKLVLIGAAANIDELDLRISKIMMDVHKWPANMREALLALYGEEYVQRTLSQWDDGWKNILKKNNGIILSKDDLTKISCPTFIVQGENDAVVHRRHLKYLKEHIPNSRVKIFKGGFHNVHLKYADDFNTLVNEFLAN